MFYLIILGIAVMLAWAEAKDSYRNPWLHAGMALLFPPLCFIVFLLPRLSPPAPAVLPQDNDYPAQAVPLFQTQLASGALAVTTPQSRNNQNA